MRSPSRCGFSARLRRDSGEYPDMPNGMTTVTRKDDFPIDGQSHFCVLEFVTVTIPGDERSRTHPGHGYPESREQYSVLHRFDSQEDLEAWLLHSRDKRIVVLSAQRLSVKEKISIEFGS